MKRTRLRIVRAVSTVALLVSGVAGRGAQTATVTEPEPGRPIVLWMRDQSRLTGFLETNTVALRTPFGPLRIPVGSLSAISRAGTGEFRDLVTLTNGDRVSGALDYSGWRVESQGTGTVALILESLDWADFTPSPTRPGGGEPGSVDPSGGSASRVDAPSPVPPGVPPRPGLIWIPPGRFRMGSPVEEAGRDLDEGPLTEVVLTRGYWMAAHEVTQAEYQELMNENPSQFVGDPRRPVEKVSWRDAIEYCERLTRHEAAANRLPIGWVYRLPTEAEWEYACRAGSTSRFTHGPDPDERELPGHAWFSDNSESSTHPVETRRANPWGIHDLSGNVLEWCLDSASSSLPGHTVTNLVNREQSQLRVARGGSWLYPGKACRSANRDSYAASTRCSDVGFRVVLAPTD